MEGCCVAYELAWEKSGVVKQFEGFVCAKEFIEAAEVVAADERFDNLRYIIKDFRNVSGTDICEKSIEYVAAVHIGSACNNPNIHIAFVTGDMAHATIAERIKETILAGAHELQIFATIENARAWVSSQSASHTRVPAHRRHLRF
jgi:hypothetical protein